VIDNLLSESPDNVKNNGFVVIVKETFSVFNDLIVAHIITNNHFQTNGYKSDAKYFNLRKVIEKERNELSFRIKILKSDFQAMSNLRAALPRELQDLL
jgi:hypothetical protein